MVVTDGFTGNIALKLMEGVSQTMLGAVRDAAIPRCGASSAGCCCARRCVGFARRSTPKGQGGAYLLGLRRLAVVPHGRFARHGFAQAILRAERGVQRGCGGR